MNPLDGIASRLIGTPLLLTEMKAQEIYSVLEARIFGTALAGEAPETLIAVGRSGRSNRPGLSENKSVAVIDISGTLVNKAGGMQAASGLRSYKAIEDDILGAAVNDKYGAIVLRINSPGGEVVGIHGVAEAVRQARSEKPVIAVVESMAASAAYWIASQADRIVAEKNSIVGSIGAIAVHVDESAALEKQGRKVTFIRSAENKMRINNAEPLSEETIAKLTASIKQIGTEFEAEVFRARGSRVDKKGVKALKADTVFAEEGLALGLIDEVGSFRSVIAELFDGAAESAEEEEVSTFASAQAAATPEPQTSKEEVAPMEQPNTGTPAAPQPAAADPEKDKLARYGAIAQACRVSNAREIEDLLVKSTASAEQCVGLAQAFGIAAAGRDEKQRKAIAAIVKPGMTPEAFTEAYVESLAANDDANPTNSANRGDENHVSTEAKAGKALESALDNKLSAMGMKLKPALATAGGL